MHPLITLTMLVSTAANAQNITGVYRLRDAHEMVAVFQFNADNTYEFGYMYGAVDRSSAGHYSIHDGSISLQSNKKPGKDFSIAREEQRDSGTSMIISDPTPYLTRHIACLFKKGTEQDLQYSDEEGKVHSRLESCDTIFVVHPLFPDAPTRIEGSNKKHNYFELTLNPSLAGVSFKDFILSITPEGLTGALPQLFEREKALFVKQTNQAP